MKWERNVYQIVFFELVRKKNIDPPPPPGNFLNICITPIFFYMLEIALNEKKTLNIEKENS